jgi:hypothetical protein
MTQTVRDALGEWQLDAAHAYPMLADWLIK